MLLAVATQRAARQKRAVHAIRVVYGNVYYDFHEIGPKQLDPNRRSSVPNWLLKSFGEDAFHSVIGLDLDAPTVNDATLNEVKHLPAVHRLFICNTAITSKGLGTLQALPNLRSLYIYGSVDDESMRYVASIPQLQELNIQNAHVTDAGIRHLRRSLRLKRLELYETEVSEGGLAELRSALPHCEIYN